MSRCVSVAGPAFPSRAFALRVGLVLAAVAAFTALHTAPASAGCGCKKAPPAVAHVRPSVTWSGAPLNLFHAALAPGHAYRVRFTSISGSTAEVVGTGVARRDLADGKVKTHLTVPVPSLPLGPAAIEVLDVGDEPVLTLPDADFTVAPAPVLLSTDMSKERYYDHRAAIARDGTVYLSADLSALREARTLDLHGKGLPLSFELEGVAFYNTQGVLMQLLDAPVPGLVTFDVKDGGKKDSTRLRYFRHEFESYFLAHGEHATHAVDPDDPEWHLDGTPHVDHDHLIIALTGSWKDGKGRAPGAPQPFTLVVQPKSEGAAPKP